MLTEKRLSKNGNIYYYPIYKMEKEREFAKNKRGEWMPESNLGQILDSYKESKMNEDY